MKSPKTPHYHGRKWLDYPSTPSHCQMYFPKQVSEPYHPSSTAHEIPSLFLEESTGRQERGRTSKTGHIDTSDELFHPCGTAKTGAFNVREGDTNSETAFFGGRVPILSGRALANVSIL